MIRPFTFICMVGALGSGLYLYQCKHQAQVLDREIARTIKQTEATRDRIGMLRAEWAQLNQPDRVSDLARAHTALQTAKPTQFVSAADLASKLPPPAAAPQQPTDMPPDETPPEPVAQAEPPPAETPTAASPAAPEPAPAGTPDRKPGRAPIRPTPVSAPVASAPSPVPTFNPAQVAAAPVHASPPPSALRPPVRHTLPAEPPRARPAVPYVQPVVAPSDTRPTYAPPAYLPAPSPPAYPAASGGSVLGGSRGALPPPVPFAAR